MGDWFVLIRLALEIMVAASFMSITSILLGQGSMVIQMIQGCELLLDTYIEDMAEPSQSRRSSRLRGHWK